MILRVLSEEHKAESLNLNILHNDCNFFFARSSQIIRIF